MFAGDEVERSGFVFLLEKISQIKEVANRFIHALRLFDVAFVNDLRRGYGCCDVGFVV